MMLKGRYSPEQISGRLHKEYPDDDTMYVSPEATYQSLFFQVKGEPKKEITAALCRGQAQRKLRGQRVPCKHSIDPMMMISDRPVGVSDQAISGYWEGDLVLGKGNNSVIGTLVEHTTRYVMLLHPSDGYNVVEVRNALTKAIDTLPVHLKGFLTWNQGSEMTGYKAFSIATDCPVYFCDFGSPWQRGSNENTDGLLRQYFPKGTDLDVYSKGDLELAIM